MAFNPYRPALSLFRFAAEVPHHPLALAASLVAPFVVRNEERGYFQSALLTTPVIALAATVGRQSIRQWRKDVQPVIQLARHPIAGMTQLRDIDQASQAFFSGAGSGREYESAFLRYLNEIPAGGRNRTQELTSLTSSWSEAMKTGKYRLIRDAFQREAVVYAETGRHADTVKAFAQAGQVEELGEQQAWLTGMFDSYKNKLEQAKEMTERDWDFVRGLSWRMREIPSLTDEGFHGAVAKTGVSRLRLYPMSSPAVAEEMDWMAKQRPELKEAIDQAIEHKWVQASQIELASFYNADGGLDRVVGITVRRKGDPALRMSVSQKNSQGMVSGQVYLEKSFDRPGVSRMVAEQSGPLVESTGRNLFELDEYAFRRMKHRAAELQKVVDQAQFHMVDLADKSGFSNYLPGQTFRLSPVQALARNQQAIPSVLGGFIKDGQEVGIGAIDPADLGDIVAGFAETAVKRGPNGELVNIGLTKLWSEGSYPYVLETKDLAKAMVGGIVNPEKNNRLLRALKPVSASDAIDRIAYNAGREAFSQTDYFTRVLPEETLPEFGAHIGSVSGHIKSLVAYLPDKVYQLQLGMTGMNARDTALAKEVEEMASQMIQKEMQDRLRRTVQIEEARNVWYGLRDWLKDPSDTTRLSKVRKLGLMGEGTHYLLHPEAMPSARATSVYYVDQPYIDLDKAIKEKRNLGLSSGQQVVLGSENGQRQIIDTTQAYLLDYSSIVKNKKNVLRLEVAEISPAETAKLDAFTKALSIGAHGDEGEASLGLLNRLEELMGTGGFYSPDVDILQVTHTGINKANPFEETVNLASDLMRRAGKKRYQRHLDQLKTFGYHPHGQTLMYKSSHLDGMDEQQIMDEGQKVADIVSDMFASTEKRLRSRQMPAKDPLFKHWLEGGEKHSSLMDYIRRFGAPANVSYTDTLEQNIPREASLTYDVLNHLMVRGEHQVLRSLEERSIVDGNTQKTMQVMEYLDSQRGLKEVDRFRHIPEGSADLTTEQAVGGAELSRLSDEAERGGGVFAPEHPIARDNWFLKLQDESYVPVLGHEAYGGKINQYGEGLFSSNQRETALAKLMEADRRGHPEEIGEARLAYLDTLKEFGYGKESWLRARRTMKSSLTGKLEAMASKLRFDPAADVAKHLGSEFHVNPFEVTIHSSMIKDIQDASVRKALLSAPRGTVNAMITRNPASAVPFVSVRIDDALPPGAIGMDEGMRGMLMADFDGDIANMFFFVNPWEERKRRITKRKGMADLVEEEIISHPGTNGWSRADELVHGSGVGANWTPSRQHRELALTRAFEGVGDDPLMAAKQGMDDLGVATGELLSKLSKESRAGILHARTGGQTIGAFSNTLTRSMLALESNSGVRNMEQRLGLQRAFWAMRQAPIRIQKDAMGGKITTQRAMTIAGDLRQGLEGQGEAAFERFYQGMQDVGQYMTKAVDWDPVMEQVGLTKPAGGGKIQPVFEWVKQNRQLLQDYHSGIDRDVFKMASHLTASPNLVARYNGDLVKAAQVGAAYLRRGSTMAQASAAALGVHNAANAGRNVVQHTREMLRQPGVRKILGIGAGIAVLAGLAGSSLRSPRQQELSEDSGNSRPSSNRFRPEEVSGVQDMIPGEPMTGSRSSNPPRRESAARGGVDTMTVAPMRDNVNLEIRTKGRDREQMAERARALARMSSDGDSNVTVNYRSSLRPTSLRHREKLREMRED